ncbi:MAG: HTTM domain-containing protein [Myxococcota bacterium]
MTDPLSFWARVKGNVLHREVDLASLAALRILFGLLLAAGQLRFLTSGWVRTQFVAPRFFFKFYGFEWVQPWSEPLLYLHVGVLIALALCLAAGFFHRVAAALFAVGFAYLQLLDVTNYLNHYYFVVLLAGLFAFLPASGLWSVDAWRNPSLRRERAPGWMLSLVRFQVAVVYVNAGLAKATSDWLIHAQPLGIWLGARTETPLIGPLLAQSWAPHAFAWAGFLFDTTIVGFLLWKKARPFAYAVVLVFHALTHLFFNIGMFPFIMVVAATVMFDPSWPRRWLRSTPPALPTAAKPLSRWAALLLGAFCLFQVLFPLRHFVYPGDVLWNEEGMRFSWKVMVREKNGSVTFHVTDPHSGRRFQVSPSQYLLPRQANEMSSQPDLILQLAHHIAADFRERGFADVEVRAEAWVSLNGRPPALLIDPTVDLAKERDGLGPKHWTLPAPVTPPVRAALVAKAR